MIEYKCILFKEPISLEPKPDLKIVGYGLLYPVTADINDDEIKALQIYPARVFPQLTDNI